MLLASCVSLSVDELQFKTQTEAARTRASDTSMGSRAGDVGVQWTEQATEWLTERVQRNEPAVLRGAFQAESHWADDARLLSLQHAYDATTAAPLQHAHDAATTPCDPENQMSSAVDSLGTGSMTRPQARTIPVRWSLSSSSRQGHNTNDGSDVNINTTRDGGKGVIRFARQGHALSYDKRNMTLEDFVSACGDRTANATVYAAQLDLATYLPGIPIPPLPVPRTTVGEPAPSSPVTIYWSGAGSPITQLHYDARDNVVCVAAGGWKRFRLVDPLHSSALLYSHADRDGNTSPVPLDLPDVVRTTYPMARFVPHMSVTLQQGDCLFLPVYWYHQVEAAPTRTISINWWRVPDRSRKDTMGRLLCGSTNRKSAKTC
eukprot:m.138187 g.138187  ORF g.138187 m.138187 type:complete len:375 (-) comp11480_c0_seq4:92-1216(-)